MHFNNDTDLYRVIGSNIKHYREQAKLTQVQLAEKAQISIRYLSKIEAAGCNKSLSISVLNQIANVLGVEIGNFFKEVVIYGTNNYSLPLGVRISMRENLIQTFLRENPGTGIGDNASRYHYNVEQFGNYGIFLKRPTQLNKGFDFTVNIDGLFFKKNRRYSNPSHSRCANRLS